MRAWIIVLFFGALPAPTLVGGCTGDGDPYADGQCFPVPPTNQTLCYDDRVEMACTAFPCNEDGSPAFCGQDAQYPGAERVFTCLGADGAGQDPCDAAADEDEVVTDSLTGLMWQRTFLTGKAWQSGKNYCDNLHYGGHSDWRLPNPLEVTSLVDDGRSSPTIDAGTFPGTPSGPFWSSSTNAEYPESAWHVDFGTGEVSYHGRDNPSHVRCVRAGTTAPGGRFSISEPVAGQGVVHDAVTGLMWQQGWKSASGWQAALSICEGLSWGGHADWRLPDKKEFLSLMSYDRYWPSSDFPGMPSTYFWTSSTDANNPAWAWRVDFNSGISYSGPPTVKSNPANAMCVRPSE